MLEYIKYLGKHSSIYFAGDFIYKSIYILLIPLYARYLSVSDYGTIETIRAIGSVLIILYTLGLDSAFGRFYI